MISYGATYPQCANVLLIKKKKRIWTSMLFRIRIHTSWDSQVLHYRSKISLSKLFFPNFLKPYIWTSKPWKSYLLNPFWGRMYYIPFFEQCLFNFCSLLYMFILSVNVSMQRWFGFPIIVLLKFVISFSLYVLFWNTSFSKTHVQSFTYLVLVLMMDKNFRKINSISTSIQKA